MLAGPPFAIVDVQLYVDGELVTTYSCDGLIVSTPVGSTAHSLSAGGPILRNMLQAFVIVPISPHTLTHRPVVDSADRTIELVVPRPHAGTSVVVDGRVLCTLTAEDRVRGVAFYGAVSDGGSQRAKLLSHVARQARLGRAVEIESVVAGPLSPVAVFSSNARTRSMTSRLLTFRLIFSLAGVLTLAAGRALPARADETAAPGEKQVAVPQPETPKTTYDLRYKAALGDIFRYEVVHRASIRSTIDEVTQAAQTRTDSVRSWKINDVLPNGDIEFLIVVERVHMVNQLPGKDPTEYDSQRDKTAAARI